MNWTIRSRAPHELVTSHLYEWREYVVHCEGADALAVGTARLEPIAPSRFLLRFENRVGHALLQPLSAGRPCAPARRVEIVSGKLGTYESYRAFTDALVADLHVHATAFVFDVAGVTAAASDGPSGHTSPLYALHLLLSRSAALRVALEVICERPHRSLAEQRELVRLARLPRAGRELVDALVRGRGPRDEAEHLTAGRAMRGFLPQNVECARSVETNDNPENRFVLGAIEVFADIARHLETLPFWSRVPSDRKTAIRELGHELERRSDHPALADVHPVRRPPSQSRVLTRREGYRQLFTIWNELHAPASPLFHAMDRAIELRDVDVLYEQWCFFALAARVAEAVGRTPKLSLGATDRALGWGVRADFGHAETLHYNLSLAGFAVPFRPDIVWCRDGRPIAVFDAKFRADVHSTAATADAKADDLWKMHAYRDGLRVASATVLYPGSATRVHGEDGAVSSSVDLGAMLEGWRGIAALPFRPET